MASQNDQDQIKVYSTARHADKSPRLAFVGCEKCSINCCDGTRYRSASVMLSEMSDIAKLFPVVFLKTDDAQKIKMSLIFTLKNMVPCNYQDVDSKKCTIWGKVRPSVCRSYPFFITETSKTNFTISTQRSCKGVQESAEGIQIFNDNNEISEEIIENFIGREILVNYEKNRSAMNKFLRLVNEFNLLVKRKIVIGKEPLAGMGFQDAVFSFLMISGEKLAALDPESIVRLQNGGYLSIIYLHLKSISNFRKLIRAATAFENSAESINMSDFVFGS